MSSSSELEKARTALATSIQKWGKKFNGETNTEMLNLISKVHELQGSDYSNVAVEKGIKYGADERQRLDIYYPKDATPDSKLPIVIFFHGGGMVFGDTDATPFFHSNIGNFLAINSTILINATYRLLPLAAHPSGAIDASLAIAWAVANSPRYGGSPSTSLTIVGHSAGGSCIGTALWGGFLSGDPLVLSTEREKERKEEVQPMNDEDWTTIINNSTFIFLSAGLWYDVDDPPTSINMPKCHRTDDKEKIRREMPVTLFREAAERMKKEREEKGKGKGRMGPKMKFFLGEWEFEEIVKGTEGCEGVWEEVFGGEEERRGEGEGSEDGDGDGTEGGQEGLDVEMVWGENHVSYVYGIGTEGSWIGGRLLEIVKGEKADE